MKSKTYTPPHPILFICDHDNLDAEIPEYSPGSITSATDTCISVATIADVDGDVTVTLASTTPKTILDSYVEVFSGSIEVRSGEVAIVTSEDEKLLATEVSSSMVQVRVFVDDSVHPERIWVEAQDRNEQVPLQ